MKKLTAIVIVLLISLSAFAAGRITEGLSGTTGVEAPGYLEVHMLNQAIDPGPAGAISINFSYIGGYDNLDFKIASSTTGNYTTANIVWLLKDGTTLNTEVLTAETDITDFDSGTLRIFIYNPVTATSNITGNIILKNN